MTNTTFQDVKHRLDNAFSEMTSETVAGCIRKANKHLEGLLQHIRAVEDLDNSDDDSSNEDKDDDNLLD